MRPFDFVRARDVDHALALLARPGAKALAGGTTLVDLMKLGIEVPETVVDIGGLPLSGIVVDAGQLRIGALASNSDVAANAEVQRFVPAVAQAILSGASGQIRNAATMGGNLLQGSRCTYFRSDGWSCNKRQPGAGCSALEGINGGHAVLGVSDACIATHPSDLAVALVAADASVRIVGPGGTRTMPLNDFFCLPGTTPHIETSLERGELVAEIVIPKTALAAASRYLKLRGRASYEFASASVAGGIGVVGDRIEDVVVCIGGVASRPWRSRAAELELIGGPLNEARVARFCDSLLSGAITRPANRHKLDLARGAISRVLGWST